MDISLSWAAYLAQKRPKRLPLQIRTVVHNTDTHPCLHSPCLYYKEEGWLSQKRSNTINIYAEF